jgi:hypothetical protein
MLNSILDSLLGLLLDFILQICIPDPLIDLQLDREVIHSQRVNVPVLVVDVISLQTIVQ